jgi:Pyruvate/2-oxoacid:ferredoxin oxidoreductase delta subunit
MHSVRQVLGVLPQVIRQPKTVTEIDHEYCRPCGICAKECPAGAIELTEIS